MVDEDVLPMCQDIHCTAVPIYHAHKRPTKGERINRRAWLGSQIVSLNERIPALEKLARKTPPKTLVAERARVAAAKEALPALRTQCDEYVREWHRLRDAGY